MFNCKECGSVFGYNYNLRRHIKKYHGGEMPLPSLLRDPVEWFPCSFCSRRYRTKCSLNVHLKKAHSGPNEYQPPSKQQKSFKNRCPFRCAFNNPKKKDLYIHLRNEHDVNLEVDTLKFSNVEEFMEWKKTIELSSKSRFILSNGIHKKRSRSVRYYICHRSGHYVCKGLGLRPWKTGVTKINAVCPASMKVSEYSNGECEVTYIKNHLGHQQDFGHILLRNEERDTMAMKITAKKPNGSMLNDLKNSICGSSEGIHFIMPKELRKFESSFTLMKKEIFRQQDDRLSIHSLADDMHGQYKSTVLFYKQQGEINHEYPFLKPNDFLLIFMNKNQQEILKKFGNNVICIDCIHGTDSNDFELVTVMTVDELQRGLPCAFMLTNRTDKLAIKLMAERLKKKVGDITASVFMGDVTESFYSGWTMVMSQPSKHLYCSWHIINTWQQNVNDKIKNLTKREEVLKIIISLMHETNVTTFETLHLETVQKLLNDIETKEFAVYFYDFYIKQKKNWAFCYRLLADINTNVHLEAIHRALKYFFLSGKNVKCLDKGILMIMRFIRDKLFDGIITLEKGEITSKIKTLRAIHNKSLEMDIKLIKKVNFGWVVRSESDPSKLYKVKKYKINCTDCQLICTECESCLHKFTCSCIENCIQWNMCKHIHLVCRSILLKQPTRRSLSVGKYFSSVNLGLPEQTLMIINEGDFCGTIECETVAGDFTVDSSDGDNEDDIELRNAMALEARKMTTINTVKELISSVTSIEEMDAIDNIVSSMEPALHTLRSETGVFRVIVQNIPGNRTIVHKNNCFQQNVVPSQPNVKRRR